VKKRDKFTKHEREIAIRVLTQSREVTNWVKSEARVLGKLPLTLAGIPQQAGVTSILKPLKESRKMQKGGWLSCWLVSSKEATLSQSD